MCVGVCFFLWMFSKGYIPIYIALQVCFVQGSWMGPPLATLIIRPGVGKPLMMGPEFKSGINLMPLTSSAATHKFNKFIAQKRFGP